MLQGTQVTTADQNRALALSTIAFTACFAVWTIFSIIGVAINEGKGPLFSLEERTAMVIAETRHLANGVEIEARPFDNLLIHFAEQIGASMIIRGLRAVSDFEYEFQMVAMNQRMNDEIETVFLMADPHHQAVSSRLVKEIARLGGRDDLFVPEAVHEKLLAKYGPKKGK